MSDVTFFLILKEYTKSAITVIINRPTTYENTSNFEDEANVSDTSMAPNIIAINHEQNNKQE